MSDTAFVYALLDVDGRPRYVGHSTNPYQRLRDHWSNKHRPGRAKCNPQLYGWLCSLDRRPRYRVIAQVSYASRYEWEAFYTERLRSAGYDLFNIRLAAGGFTATPEVRAKMSAAHRGRKWSAGALAKRSASMTGQRRSAEARARMSAAQKARFVRRVA